MDKQIIKNIFDTAGSTHWVIEILAVSCFTGRKLTEEGMSMIRNILDEDAMERKCSLSYHHKKDYKEIIDFFLEK